MKTQQRDDKGRFTKVNNNTTTNTNKENKTITKKEMRMKQLQENGMNTNNFFSINVEKDIPAGSKINISIERNENTLTPEQIEAYKLLISTGAIDANVPIFSNGKEVNIDKDIIESIEEKGFVNNHRLFRRWVLAQTMRMLNSKEGWTGYLNKHYDYKYQFTMMRDEFKALAKMEKENPESEDFEIRSKFFTKYTFTSLLNDYAKKLRAYIEKARKEKKRTYYEKEYVKLHRFGNVYVNELDIKVFRDITIFIQMAEDTRNYGQLYKVIDSFIKTEYNKLPYDTKLCKEWIDDFKGAGAYYSLQNMVQFGKCYIMNPLTKKAMSRSQSLEYIKEKVEDYKGEYYRFRALLKQTIKFNNFNLKEMIEMSK